MYTESNSTPLEQEQPQTKEQQEDCTQGESVLENKIQVITKIESITNISRNQTIINKLNEFIAIPIGEKYSQNIQIPLQPPIPVDIATVNTNTPTCNITPNTQSKYYVCKYPDIGKRTLSEYIKELPNIHRILDQYDQILKTVANLAIEKKLIHHAIQNSNIIVKNIENIPIITNFKQAAFLYYEQEMNIDNFDTILTTATTIHCLEAHILVYLGNKKREQDPSLQNQWKTTKYDQQQHEEATQGHSQSTNQYPEYIDKTYEEVYREIAKTFPKWDIYSITTMFLTIIREIPEAATELEPFIAELTKLLSIKTLELPITVPVPVPESAPEPL